MTSGGRKAKYDGERWPNGWPIPTFADCDDDGDFTFEWCFGKQGSDDSWRILLCVGASGTSVSRATHTPFGVDYLTTEDGHDVLAVHKQLRAWLEDA